MMPSDFALARTLNMALQDVPVFFAGPLCNRCNQVLSPGGSGLMKHILRRAAGSIKLPRAAIHPGWAGEKDTEKPQGSSYEPCTLFANTIF